MYNLTDLANKVIQVASQFASHKTNEVGTEHILYGLTKVESKSKQLLSACRITSDVIVEVLNRYSLRSFFESAIGMIRPIYARRIRRDIKQVMHRRGL